MKYKVGDEVELKTWEEMQKKHTGDLWNPSFKKYMEIDVPQLFPDRVFEITDVNNATITYSFRNSQWHWNKDYIEELAKKPEPINSRFEILDL